MEKFRIVANGYDPIEVNDFLDDVIKRIEKLVVENQRLSMKLKRIQTEKKDSADLEDKLNKAIMLVSDTTDRMKEVARAEAEMVVNEAKRNADAIIHEALLNAQKTEIEASTLKKNIAVYKSRIGSILSAQLELNDEMDKLEL